MKISLKIMYFNSVKILHLLLFWHYKVIIVVSCTESHRGCTLEYYVESCYENIKSLTPQLLQN